MTATAALTLHVENLSVRDTEAVLEEVNLQAGITVTRVFSSDSLGAAQDFLISVASGTGTAGILHLIRIISSPEDEGSSQVHPAYRVFGSRVTNPRAHTWNASPAQSSASWTLPRMARRRMDRRTRPQ